MPATAFFRAIALLVGGIITSSTFAQSTPGKSMITTVSVGYRSVEVSGLNTPSFQAVLPMGLPELADIPSANVHYGLSGFGQFGHWLAGFDLGGFMSQKGGSLESFASSEGDLTGLSVILYTGYNRVRHSRWAVYPLFGLGVSAHTVQYRFTPSDPNQVPATDFTGRTLTISNDRFIADIGAGVHRFWPWKNAGKSAIAVGLRTGYILPLVTFDQWARLAGQVVSAPDFGGGGFYVKLSVGGGIWQALAQ
ncbi:MAG: hypothetical protein AAGB22_10440 [Bacteroidota bacterium]